MKALLLYKRNLLEISHLCLALLIFSINMNGANLFHTKEISFFLFLLVSLPFGSYKNLLPLLTMIAIYFFSLIANFTNPYMNLSQGLRYSMGLMYLVLLVFSNRQYASVIIKSYFISALIVGIVTVFLWIVCKVFPILKTAFLLYFNSVDTGEYAFLFMIRDRKILNWWIPGVYYCTAPSMIPALAYSLYRAYKTKSWKYIFSAVVLTAGLMLTMARANILAAFALNFFYICIRQLKKKQMTAFFLILCFSLCLSVLIVFLFLSDKSEASLSVKTLHKLSYYKEFDSNLFKFFLTGWGAGSQFYSFGYREWTYITELSLYETIRRYGLVSTIIIFLGIWLSPLVYFCKRRKHLSDMFFWAGAFFAYLFVACTNPFLLGSIGFCALLFMSTVLKYQTE